MPESAPHMSRVIRGEGPDTTYWTAYYHYMVEREARAARRAYAWALIKRGVDALCARVAGTRLGDGAQRSPRLSPRT